MLALAIASRQDTLSLSISCRDVMPTISPVDP